MQHENKLKFRVVKHNACSDYDWMNIDFKNDRVGKVRGRTCQNRIIIYSINIFPRFERRGYATQTLLMIKQHFDSITADRVRFTAREFWKKMGFTAEQNGSYIWKR